MQEKEGPKLAENLLDKLGFNVNPVRIPCSNVEEVKKAINKKDKPLNKSSSMSVRDYRELHVVRKQYFRFM